MYETIYVPVDNSDYSNQAVASAIQLGKAFDSKLVGCHVYAASMHDYRFKQMEYTLPEEYLEETELERQRKIHDSLITMGLELISDSYLDAMKQDCERAGIDFEPKMMDGKHHVEIVKDIKESEYDLTVLGVMGIGRVRDTQIGSVCERVTRSADRDVWVVKSLPPQGDAEHTERDTILVGVDGSPQSFGALVTAIELAGQFGKKVEAISVYDPYLHYSVFKGVVNVLTEKASKIFRFEEQNQLHEEIIDTGLAQIYQSHLDVAQSIAEEHGVELTKTLLDGKAFQKILDHVRKTEPWLVVVGRVGVHGEEGEQGLGSNAENLLRSCPCDVLFSTRLEYPQLDVKAEESIRWTQEAEDRFERVPDMVKGIARTALYRLAVEQGHSVISSDLLDEAMDRYMPKYTAKETEQLAETIALQLARSRPTFLCKRCGVTSAEADPKKCGVCGGDSFEVITEEMLDRIASMEGGLDVETTYDGRKLKWTADAKRGLKTIPDLYQRRRAKARIEKKARIQKLPTVTLSFAQAVIEEETGVPLVLPSVEEQSATAMDEQPHSDDDRRLIARDAERRPLLSMFDWSPEAVGRLFRVPAGLMRDRTQERVETLAREQDAAEIDLAMVEDGIELGRQLMEEMIRSYEAKEQDATTLLEQALSSHASSSEAGSSEAESEVANGALPSAEAEAVVEPEPASGGRCPFSSLATGDAEVDEKLKSAAKLYLNEVGLMSALADAQHAAASSEASGSEEESSD